MNVEEADFYEENLFGNDESEHLPCSARSIIYCPTGVAKNLLDFRWPGW